MKATQINVDNLLIHKLLLLFDVLKRICHFHLALCCLYTAQTGSTILDLVCILWVLMSR